MNGELHTFFGSKNADGSPAKISEIVSKGTDGLSTYSVYDDTGRIIRITRQDKYSVTFEWNGSTVLATLIDPSGPYFGSTTINVSQSTSRSRLVMTRVRTASGGACGTFNNVLSPLSDFFSAIDPVEGTNQLCSILGLGVALGTDGLGIAAVAAIPTCVAGLDLVGKALTLRDEWCTPPQVTSIPVALAPTAPVPPAPAPSAPKINGISPARPTTSQGSQTIRVSGSGFSSSMTGSVSSPLGSRSALGSGQFSNLSSTGVDVSLPLSNPGAYSFLVTSGSASSNAHSFQVDGAAAPPAPPPHIVTTSLPSGTVGKSYSTALSADSGTAPYSWSVVGAIVPPGLSLSAAGTLSGTPTQAGGYGFQLRVTDARGGTADGVFSINIDAAVAAAPILPHIDTNSPLPTGSVGAAYSLTFAADSGTSPYSWAVTSGNVAPGLALSSSGLLSGTPTQSGTFSFAVKVTEGRGQTDQKSFSLTINSSTAAPSPPSLAITTASRLPDAKAGFAYSVTFGATGGTTPYHWSLIAGAQPANLTLNGDTGVLGGDAVEIGVFNFRIQVNDKFGNFTQMDFSLTVSK